MLDLSSSTPAAPSDPRSDSAVSSCGSWLCKRKVVAAFLPQPCSDSLAMSALPFAAAATVPEHAPSQNADPARRDFPSSMSFASLTFAAMKLLPPASGWLATISFLCASLTRSCMQTTQQVQIADGPRGHQRADASSHTMYVRYPESHELL